MTNDLFNAFAKTIDNLVELNLAFRAERDLLADKCHAESLLNHFGTVQVDVGRLTGKTTYIAHRAIHDTIAIVSAPQEKRYVLSINANAQIFTIDEFMNSKPSNFMRCFIDNPSLVFAINSRPDVIKKSVQLGINMLILLGD